MLRACVKTLLHFKIKRRATYKFMKKYIYFCLLAVVINSGCESIPQVTAQQSQEMEAARQKEEARKKELERQKIEAEEKAKIPTPQEVELRAELLQPKKVVLSDSELKQADVLVNRIKKTTSFREDVLKLSVDYGTGILSKIYDGKYGYDSDRVLLKHIQNVRVIDSGYQFNSMRFMNVEYTCIGNQRLREHKVKGRYEWNPSGVIDLYLGSESQAKIVASALQELVKIYNGK